MSKKKLSKVQMGWDVAIADAKREVEKIQTAILVFEENKRKGEPWPGTQLRGQDSEQQHSD